MSAAFGTVGHSDYTSDIDAVRTTAHALTGQAVVSALASSLQEGLDDNAVRLRIDRFGSNTLRSRRRASRLVILRNQLISPVVYLLAGAAALAFWFGEWIEGQAIIVVLFLNTLVVHPFETF